MLLASQQPSSLPILSRGGPGNGSPPCNANSQADKLTGNYPCRADEVLSSVHLSSLFSSPACYSYGLEWDPHHGSLQTAEEQSGQRSFELHFSDLQVHSTIGSLQVLLFSVRPELLDM